MDGGGRRWHGGRQWIWVVVDQEERRRDGRQRVAASTSSGPALTGDELEEKERESEGREREE